MISEEKRTRGQFCRFHSEVVRDVVWETDPSYRYTWVSPADFGMRGFEDHEVIGKSVLEFLPAESHDPVKRSFTESLRRMMSGNGTPVVQSGMFQSTADGAGVSTEITVRAVIEEGRHLGFVGSTRDLSREAEDTEKIRDYLGEIASLRSELNLMATTDRLTGLANRSRFDEAAQEEARRSNRYGLTFSIALIDIDRLQTVNERFGRLSGDEVLRSLSELIRRCIRNIDHAFRWDGGEFALVLPNTALHPASGVAERIRSTVEGFSFPAIGRITVSIGLAESVKDEDQEALVARADRALHAAKTGGRNRVALAPAGPA